jgi:hypothetical protein
MVKKTEISTAVTQLEKELSKPSGTRRPRQSNKSKKDVAEPSAEASDEKIEDHEAQLEDVEQLLQGHELDAAELKRLLTNFLEELKDLPSRKPLVTVVGAFLLGFVAGRSSHK